MDDDELFGQLEDVFAQVDAEEIENLRDVDVKSLITRISEITEILLRDGQALNPRTSEARDMHSERYACQLELSRRKC
jgi:hypothetical protein